jgi:hypothetical protein
MTTPFAAFDTYQWGDPLYAQLGGSDAMAYGTDPWASVMMAAYSGPEPIQQALSWTDTIDTSPIAGGGNPIAPAQGGYMTPAALDNNPQTGGGPYEGQCPTGYTPAGPSLCRKPNDLAGCPDPLRDVPGASFLCFAPGPATNPVEGVVRSVTGHFCDRYSDLCSPAGIIAVIVALILISVALFGLVGRGTVAVAKEVEKKA